MAFFPLAGLAIAIFPALFILAFYQFLAPLFSSLTVVLIFTTITGALHLDGLADTVDGIYGGRDKAEMLKIMRDSSIGVFGVIALIFALSFKTLLLNELWLRGDKVNLIKAVFVFPVMARWSLVTSAWLMPYARREQGVGEVFAKNVTYREWLISTLFAALIVAPMIRLYAIVFFPLVFLTTLFWARYFTNKAGGVTGDIFGAINEIIEIFSLFIFLLYRGVTL
jgi:adenosylcobinamide-GDP ribazoletransferase